MERGEVKENLLSLIINELQPVVPKLWRGIYPLGFEVTRETLQLFMAFGFNTVVLEETRREEIQAADELGVKIAIKPSQLFKLQEAMPFEKEYDSLVENVLTSIPLTKGERILYWESPYSLEGISIHKLLDQGRLPLDIFMTEVGRVQRGVALLYKPPSSASSFLLKGIQSCLLPHSFLLADDVAQGASHQLLRLQRVAIESRSLVLPPLLDLPGMSRFLMSLGGGIVSLSKEEFQNPLMHSQLYIIGRCLCGESPLQAYYEWLSNYEPRWFSQLPLLLEFSTLLTSFMGRKDELFPQSLKRETVNYLTSKISKKKKEAPELNDLWALLDGYIVDG